MIFPVLIIAACQPGVSDTTFDGGRLDGLARYAGGLGLSGGSSSAPPPDSGIAFQPGSRFGFYESPVIDARFVTTWTTLGWTLASPAGLPLPNDGGTEHFQFDSFDMRDNVALFHFDEPAWTGAPGEVLDSSGQGNHGSADGGASTISQGLVGRAATFDGSACVLVPDALTLNPTTSFTLATWFFARGLTGNPQGLISKREDFTLPSAYTLFLWTGDNVWFDVDTENDRASGTVVIQAGQWHHAALVYDGTRQPLSRVTLYLDGVRDRESAESSATVPANVAELALGCLPNPMVGPVQGLDGLLDEAALWRRPLNANEVRALYARGASRVLFQVRSCADVTCSLGPQWVGPGGVAGTYFTGTGGPMSLPNAQFVQYRLWMQNDTEVQRVELEGFMTVPGACTPDAGVADAGVTDAGVTDAGLSDAGAGEPADGAVDPRALVVACGCSASEGLGAAWLVLMLWRRGTVRARCASSVASP